MSTTRAPQLPNARVALYNFVQDRLTAVTGQTLAAFILERRPEADPVPYRRIASELVDLTGIDITHEAVRRWHHRALEAAGTPMADRHGRAYTVAPDAPHPAHAAALAS